MGRFPQVTVLEDVPEPGRGGGADSTCQTGDRKVEAGVTRPPHRFSFTKVRRTPYHTHERLPRRFLQDAPIPCSTYRPNDRGTRVPEDR